MANAEQLTLSEYIKGVHRNLRKETRLLGEGEAWRRHCDHREQLQRYAAAMQKLATECWDPNMEDSSKAVSRISWVHSECESYFRRGQILQCRQKESDVALKNDIPLNTTDLPGIDSETKLKLLDVGSCYNPFEKFQCFDVFPIDLAPAASNVYKCDFLNVPVTKLHHEIKSNDVLNLEELFFNVVVFSLFLEYLPSPEQRLLSCKKAHALLKPEGLLLVVTPDSKHVSANAKYMKSWRHALAEIGLSRVKYVKLPHIHCMTFRKCLNPKVSQRWAELHKNNAVFDGIFIPQDFNVPTGDYGSIKNDAGADASEDYDVLLENLPYCMEFTFQD